MHPLDVPHSGKRTPLGPTRAWRKWFCDQEWHSLLCGSARPTRLCHVQQMHQHARLPGRVTPRFLHPTTKGCTATPTGTLCFVSRAYGVAYSHAVAAEPELNCRVGGSWATRNFSNTPYRPVVLRRWRRGVKTGYAPQTYPRGHECYAPLNESSTCSLRQLMRGHIRVDMHRALARGLWQEADARFVGVDFVQHTARAAAKHGLDAVNAPEHSL